MHLTAFPADDTTSTHSSLMVSEADLVREDGVARLAVHFLLGIRGRALARFPTQNACEAADVASFRPSGFQTGTTHEASTEESRQRRHDAVVSVSVIKSENLSSSLG